MKTPLLAALTTMLLLATAPAVAPVQATTAILQCQSSDGTLVYTDKACSAFGAMATPMSGELLTRIAHEEARAQDDISSAGTLSASSDDMISTDAVTPSDSANPARRSSSSGCARTPTQLSMDLRSSLLLGDVNRVAESYHWVGMSSKQGERTLDRLQHLLGKPVVDSHYFDAQISLSGMPDEEASVVASNANVGGDAGILQLVLGNEATRSVVDFGVQKCAGCYFVKF